MKVPTKPTLTQRALAFFDDYWGAIILGIAVVIAVLGVVFYEPPAYIRAPLEHCAQSYTGRQRVQEMVHYQCAAYDSKMNCTVNMPVYTQSTQQEVNVLCNWNEWR